MKLSKKEKEIIDERKKALKDQLKREKKLFSGKYKWWIFEPEKVTRLKEAYSWGCSGVEARAYAEITKKQEIYYQKQIDTNWRLKKKKWKRNPEFVARRTISKAVDTKPEIALAFIKAKKSKEFAEITKKEVSGPNGQPIEQKFTGIPGTTLNVDLRSLSDQELEIFENLLEKAKLKRDGQSITGNPGDTTEAPGIPEQSTDLQEVQQS